MRAATLAHLSLKKFISKGYFPIISIIRVLSEPDDKTKLKINQILGM